MLLEIAAGTLVVATGLWLALGGGRSTSTLFTVGEYSLLALLLLGFLGVRHFAPRAEAASAPVLDRPVEVREDGYVSSDTCRGCHPQHYATWHDSYHRSMTRVASDATVLAPFDGEVLDLHGDAYRVRREGDAPVVDWPERLLVPHVTAPVRRVAMVTGSHHAQVYWLPTGQGRTLELFPFAWRIAERRWIPLEGIFLYPPGTAQETEDKGEWNVLCSRCHATHPKPRIAGLDMDTTAAELGIACESCHGPAEEHVAANRSPFRRFWLHLSGGEDATIVNPESLSPERGAEVCGQCHSVFHFRDRDDTYQFTWKGLPYRPGDELWAERVLANGKRDDNFWSDGMVRTSGREYNGLVRSPCYANAKAGRPVLECTSCHEMHRAADDPRPLAAWQDDQLGVGKDGDGACVGCHPQYDGDEALARHTRHEPASEGSRCMNCHMPNTSYGLLKATRSHEISSPSVEASVATGRPNACNLCHLDRTLGWTAEELREGWGLAPPPLPAEAERVSAAVGWILSGDAAQRALVAWSMGWKPAQDASGREWMAPYLAQLLVDPYAANRFLAARSLRTLPGFGSLEVDSMAPGPARQAARERVFDAITERPPRGAPPATLFGADGHLDLPRFEDLLSVRNNRPVTIKE